jgi:predicted nucleic acid-binding protein
LILLDTTFLLGYFNSNDQWHESALNISDTVDKKDKIVSNLIIAEIIASIGSLLGGSAGKTVYDHILDNYVVYNENRALYNKAMNTFLKYDGTLSLADSVSIEIMAELKIYEIASFDSDFDNKKGIIRIH